MSAVFPLLALVFLAVPIAEVYLLIQVGHVIGGLATIALLVADAVLGSWLVRREGARAWRRFREAAASGRVPGREAADGALVLVGGTLLVTPGFLTDVVGLVLVLPITRPLVRRALVRLLARRAGARLLRGRTLRRGGRTTSRLVGGGDVVEGEVVEGEVVER